MNRVGLYPLRAERCCQSTGQFNVLPWRYFNSICQGLKKSLWRTLIITHRYRGVAVGLLMASWFIRGIVIMYPGFPQPAGSERLHGLPPIAWADCCRIDVCLMASQLGVPKSRCYRGLPSACRVGEAVNVPTV